MQSVPKTLLSLAGIFIVATATVLPTPKIVGAGALEPTPDMQRLTAATPTPNPLNAFENLGLETEELPGPVLDQAASPQAVQNPSTPESSSSSYTLGDLTFQGVIFWEGLKFTYYSQSVLPGGGLNIPGRHVNAGGFVSDADGFIVLAGSAALGTVYNTPFGWPGKIYDRGTTGNHLDVYTM